MLAATPVTAFDRSLWQSPIISDKSGVTEIRIETAPAGLFLRERLDPMKRYKLKVKGRGGPITMRLQIDNKAQEYLAAPAGVTDRTITGASHLELLFYSDKPATYRLESAEIEECPNCRTINDLHKRIVNEVPEVATATGLKKAILLMEWTANKADYTPNPELIPPDFESWPPEKDTFEFFDQDKGGVFCGGSAVFLRQILRVFGIDAFTVNFGLPNPIGDPRHDFTHVTVVVPIGAEFYIVDPYFAVTFERNGRPLNIKDGIAAAKAGQLQFVKTVQHPLERRDIVGVTPEIESLCASRRTASSNVLVCKLGQHTQFEVIKQLYRRNWETDGIPLESGGIFKLMTKGFFSVGPSTDPSARDRFIAMLRQEGIPLHRANPY
jgi:hypothetical protein